MDTVPNNRDLKTAVESKLEPLIEQVMESFGLAGLAIGIVKDGEFAYARGFGVRDVETKEPITPRSLFHMASVSKPFVATAIMQLVEQGKIRLDAPVITYLPYFKLNDERADMITVQQMLSHVGGMPDAADYQWYQPEYDDGALERYVRGLAGEQLIAAPGEKFAYSNIAYEVLGDVIAKVSGRTFEAYMKESVLDPLGMVDSTFLRGDVAPALAMTPHFGAPLMVIPEAYPYNRAHAPSSTLHSNVIEMGNWALANLNRGEFNSNRILQPGSYDLLWAEYAQEMEDDQVESVGLGWFIRTHRGRRVIHHGGADPGFETTFAMLPDDGVAIVILANSNTAPVGSLAEAALDVLLGFKPQAPKPPVTALLGPVLAAEGPQAAIHLFNRLRSTRSDDFAFDVWPFFTACWGAIEVKQAERVLPLAQLCLSVLPESSEAHELLGWAYMFAGETDLAIDNLRKALALNAGNEHAAQLLRQLSRV